MRHYTGWCNTRDASARGRRRTSAYAVRPARVRGRAVSISGLVGGGGLDARKSSSRLHQDGCMLAGAHQPMRVVCSWSQQLTRRPARIAGAAGLRARLGRGVLRPDAFR